MQTKYEFYKVFSKRFICFLLPAILFLNVALYLNEQKKNDRLIENLQEYRVEEQIYIEMSPEQAEKKLTAISEKLSVFEQISMLSSVTDDEFLKEELEKLQNDNPKLVEEYNESYVNQSSKLEKEANINRMLLDQAKYINGYKSYIQEVDKKSKDMLSFSIFQEEDSFSYRNILKTSEDFKHLENVPLKMDLAEGITTASEYRITDILIVLFVFLICIYLFWQEKENQLLNLVKSNPNGRTGSIISKLITLLTLSVATALVMYGSIFVASNSIYGLGDTSRYVQSMSEFQNCNIILTVKEYITIFIVSKLALVALIGLFFAFLFTFMNNSSTVYASVAVIFSLSYIANRFIHPLSYFNILKYINVVAFLDTHSVYTKYNNISLFGFPINRVVFSALFVGILIILLAISIWMIFICQRKSARKSFLGLVIEKINKKLTRYLGSVNLFWHEVYKLLISNKAILVILLMALVSYKSIIVAPPSFGNDDTIYNSYINQLEGELTLEKELFMENEREHLNTLPQQISVYEKQFTENKITENELKRQQFLLTLEEEKQKPFARVENQYKNLLEMKEKGVQGSFINEINSDFLFDSYQRDVKNGIMLSVVIILCIGMVFGKEYKNNSISILTTTKNGRAKLFVYKNIVATISAVVLLAIVYFPQYYNASKLYNLADYSAPIQSIIMFSGISLNISIAQYIEITFIGLILGATCISNLVILLSITLKKQTITIFIASFIVVIPLMLEMLGVELLRYITFNNIFLINDSVKYIIGLAKQTDIIKTLVYIVCIAISSIAILWIAFARFNKYKLLGGQAYGIINKKHI